LTSVLCALRLLGEEVARAEHLPVEIVHAYQFGNAQRWALGIHMEQTVVRHDRESFTAAADRMAGAKVPPRDCAGAAD
jgi:hypothetical protein